jgi:hypothetical protein
MRWKTVSALCAGLLVVVTLSIACGTAAARTVEMATGISFDVPDGFTISTPLPFNTR